MSLVERSRFGLCVWLTGLSGAGKSTTAVALAAALQQSGCVVTLLDGDVLRAADPTCLGFSKADRDRNVLRAARQAVAAVRRGEIAICALISPYRDARAAARQLIGIDRFVEVFVDTPLAICETRDPKGLYDRRSRGEVRALTGIDDPYETPLDADVVLDTCSATLDDNVNRLMVLLAERLREAA